MSERLPSQGLFGSLCAFNSIAKATPCDCAPCFQSVLCSAGSSLVEDLFRILGTSAEWEAVGPSNEK